MDRITSALLTEFSVENQFEKFPEETRFEHFAAYLATSRHVADTFDTADLATGAGGDTGIDAIAILINGSLSPTRSWWLNSPRPIGIWT